MATTSSAIQLVDGDTKPQNPGAGNKDVYIRSGVAYKLDSSGNETSLCDGSVIKPQEIEGVFYVDSTNSQGWSGGDVGAWLNAAYAAGVAKYPAPIGFVIQMAAGNYTMTTPVVFNTPGVSIILRGAGNGLDGGTFLNYTPTTATTALTVGGSTGNDGGVQLEDFMLRGAGLANPTIGLNWGSAAVGTSQGFAKCVSIANFGTGVKWQAGGLAYGITMISCPINFCATGAAPTGENNVFIGCLFGGNTVGVVLVQESMFFGCAFDDNTTNALSQTTSNAITSLANCRFENAGLGTSQYINLTNGNMTITAGNMNEDNTTGTATGFIQASGGVLTVLGTILYSGGRVLTQAFNLSGTVLAHIDTVVSTFAAANTFPLLTTAGYVGAPRRLDWVRLSNYSTAVQNIAALGVAPGTYITNSNLNLPNPLTVGITTAFVLEWTFTIAKSAVGTGNFSFIFFAGTNGTTADTQLVTVSLTQTAVVDNALITATLVCATAGASGTFTGAISGVNKAATATGFGFVAGTSGPAAVTSGAFNTTTAGLKFGLGVASSVGTPAVTISNVKARAINID